MARQKSAAHLAPDRRHVCAVECVSPAIRFNSCAAVKSISLQPASGRFCNFDCFDQLSIFSGSAPERMGNSSVSERTKAFAACA